jgi:hypothetical protein
MIADFIIVEGLIIIFATIITLIVGAAPDACGRCRNCWIGTIPQAVKDNVK